MPNHVITTISTVEADSSALEALGRSLTEEERKEEAENHESLLKSLAERKSPYTPTRPDPDRWIVDFRLLIPEPERLFTGGCNGQHPHPHPDGGFYDDCWYSWNRNNWGTKWNGYEGQRNEGGVSFQTAWSHPYPVVEALSRKFPEITFDVRYADEDRGANCAHYVILDGGVIGIPLEDPLRFAVELWGQSWEEYQEEMAEYAREEERYAALELIKNELAQGPATETAVVKGEVL